jgi:hypothetical protein
MDGKGLQMDGKGLQMDGKGLEDRREGRGWLNGTDWRRGSNPRKGRVTKRRIQRGRGAGKLKLESSMVT